METQYLPGSRLTSKRLLSVINSAARLVFSSSKFDHARDATPASTALAECSVAD